jgi:hypothetical protein
MFTVKIGAIEQQTVFLQETLDGKIGIELGADVTANLDLDEFMVFEQNESRAREFYTGLILKHITAGVEERERVSEIRNERDLVRIGFSDARAFDELARAAEGIPRDAINVLAKAAQYAAERKISVPDIRKAAVNWYQTDKAGALRNRDSSLDLLNWIIDNVIRGKKSRGFLVNQKDTTNKRLNTLFDARVLHLVRRGYSAQDQPGERFDVFVIDYGAYADLMNTKNAPTALPSTVDDNEEVSDFEIPIQDLRSLRRAILDLSQYEKEFPADIPNGA